MKARSLFSSSAWSMLSALCAYGLTIILANGQSAQAVSALLYTMVWGLIIAQTIDFGAEQCAVHFIKQGGRGFEEALAGILTLKGAIFLLIALLTLAFNSAGVHVVPNHALLFALPGFYLGPLFEIHGKVALYAKVLAAERVAYLCASLVYLQFYELNASFYLIYFVLSGISWLAQVRILALKLSGFSHASFALARTFSAAYWPTVATLAAQLSYGHFSRILIEAKLGLLMFGAVSLGFQIVNAISIIQVQVDRHVRPELLDALNDGANDRLVRLAGRYLLFYLLPLAIGATLLALFSAPLVRAIFGEKWMAVAGVLECLAPLLVMIAILRLFDIVAIATDARKANLSLNIVISLLMLLVLQAMPAGAPVSSYLMAIVGAQFIHLTLLGSYLMLRLKKRDWHPA